MDDFSAQIFCTLRQHQMLKNGDTVIVACSGGADSVSLLHFLHCNAAQLGITVRAAHVNHALRGADSDADAQFVAQLCAKWKIPLDTATLVPPAVPSEAWARIERYAFLERLAAQYHARVATAHTQNDNAETVLLHLVRGAGVHGAAGIPPVRGVFVRPLLRNTRAQVECYLADNHLRHVTDATNHTDVYARNRVRRTVLPALDTVHAGAVQALARFADDMAQTAAYLDEQARTLLAAAQCGGPAQESLAYRAVLLAEAPAPVCKAALRLLILPHADPSAATLTLAQQAVQQGRGAVQLSAQRTLAVRQGLVRMENSTPPAPQSWYVPFSVGQLRLPGGTSLMICTQSYEEFIKFEKTRPTPLIFHADYDRIQGNAGFRTRQPQDTFAPVGRGVTKSMKKLLSEAKLPLAARATLPLLANGHTVLWAAGFGFAESVAPDAHTHTVVTITIQTEEEKHDA